MNRLNQLLNVSQKEWPRILVAWMLTFLTRIGFIVGWTILIATTLSRAGIHILPLLFVGNALFVMLGTLIYRHFIHRIRREILIIVTTLLGIAFLLTAAALMQENNALFFFVFLCAQGIFIAQLGILISLFNEELFSPLESQRIFPLLESAETIGGIIAGILLGFFASSLAPYKFILLGVLLLFAVIPIIFKFNSKTLSIPTLGLTPAHHPKHLKDQLHELKKIPFIKGLMLVVLLHWAMMNIIEFQSMKAIQQSVSHQEEETLVEHPTNSDIHLASLEDGQESHEGNAQPLHTESAFAEKLGLLHILFYSSALLMQLIFASRILSSLGTIPTMMIHPLVTLLSVITMSLRFNIVTTSITRGSYELSSILFKNALDSSAYALSHSMREETRELLQGLIRPMGAILGALLLLLTSLGLSALGETLTLNALVLLGSILMLFTLKTLAKNYSQLCEQNLSHKNELPLRLSSIEILGQKGHERNFPALEKLLKRESEPLVVKEGILKTLGLREEVQSISSILEMFEQKNERLRLNAVEALSHFKDLKAHLLTQAFTRYRVLEGLKNLLLKEENEAVREEALRCFYDLAPEELTPYLLECIQKNTAQKAAFVEMLKLFPDPNLSYYVKPYLNDPNPELRAAALIALWQFPDQHGEWEHRLRQLLENPHSAAIKAGLHAAGTVQWLGAKPLIQKHLHCNDQRIEQEAILALAKLEESSVIPSLIQRLKDPAHEWFEKSSLLLASLPKKIQDESRYILHMHFVESIHDLLSKKHPLPVAEWEEEAIRRLKTLYAKLGAHEEVHALEKILARTD